MHHVHSSPLATYQVEKEYHSSSRSSHVHVQEAAHQAHQVLPVHQEHRAQAQVDHPYIQLVSLDTHERAYPAVHDAVVVAVAAVGRVVAAGVAAVEVAAVEVAAAEVAAAEVAAAEVVAVGNVVVNLAFRAFQVPVHQKRKA